MVDSKRLLIYAFPPVRAVLARHYGWRWPLAFARCAVRWRTLVRQTRWAGRHDDEAKHVRALALIPAVYLVLRERIGPPALDVARELASSILASASERLARDASWSALRDPRARWHAFFERTVARGVGAFNESECLSVEVERFHLRVRRCVFADLAGDIGLPELARMTCDLAVPFCRELLPSHNFRRNGSLESTLAYGHPHCDYLWEPKDAPAADLAASEVEVAPRTPPTAGAPDAGERSEA